MPITTTVITGPTSGIGKETAMALAKKDHALYLLVRDMEKGEKLKQEISIASKNYNIYVVHCDLADLESVRNAADTLRSSLLAINVLINNAGGIFANRHDTKDGHEMTFQVNHLSHFLLTMALMPLLQRGQARIINVSSEAHRMAKPRLNDLQWQNHDYSAMQAYAMAKLYNIYFTRSLALRYGPKGITSFALHPGLVSTAFGSELTGVTKIFMWLAQPFMITPEQGAQTTIHLATVQRIDAQSGKYFKNKRPTGTASIATDDRERDKLWAISEEMVAGYLER